MLERIWYSNSILAYPLLPLTAVFLLLSLLRRFCYRIGILRIHRLPVPVIVVGNITVGGTGKTPLVVWLTDYLRIKGFKPGIISRGYGGKAKHWPQQVRPDSDPKAVGDEAILLSRRTACPMAVGPDRYAAGKALLDNAECDIIVADDGLQHYALGRDVEIAVIDGKRRFGNGLLLPAGPLREGPWRLQYVDIRVSNGAAAVDECSMKLRSGELVSLGNDKPCPLESFSGRRVHAVAGVGNPDAFFQLLRRHGVEVVEQRFADHHDFSPEDLDFAEKLPVIMTEKDAVKCQYFTGNGYWYLQVSAQPEALFVQRFYELTEEIKGGQETA